MNIKNFKRYLSEETMPFANIKSGKIGIEDSDVRDQINLLLTSITSNKFVTPYIALERVAKTLANFHIFIPSQTFLEGDSGVAIWPVNQFGLKIGQTNTGDFVSKGEIGKDLTHGPHMGGEGVPEPKEGEEQDCYVYFEYRMSDCGMFKIFCEVVEKDELDEILEDLEYELSDESKDDDDYLEEEHQLDETSKETKEKKRQILAKFGQKLSGKEIRQARQSAKDPINRDFDIRNLTKSFAKESLEQIDEISSNKALKYYKASMKDVTDTSKKAAGQSGPEYRASVKKVHKRQAGQELVASKIAGLAKVPATRKESVKEQ